MPKASTFGPLIASQVIASDSLPLLTNAGDNKRIPVNELQALMSSVYTNVKNQPYAAVGNGSADDGGAILAAAGAVGDGGVIYLPPGDFAIASNLTLTCGVVFARGAILKPATGVVLTLNGPITAGVQQIFDLQGTASVAFGAGSVDECQADWFKANTIPGTTDMAAALQAAIESVNERRGVRIPIRAYAISTTVVVNERSVVLEGSGWGIDDVDSASYLKWIGSAGIPMLKVWNCQGSRIRNFRLIGDPDFLPSCGIQHYQTSAAPNNYNSYENIWLGAAPWDPLNYTTQMSVGVSIDGDFGGNDSNKFDMIVINQCPIGIHITSSQYLLQHFSNLFIWYASTAAIKSKANISGNNWFFALNTVDVWTYDANELSTIDVQSFNSESGGRMLLLDAGGTVHIHSGYWQARDVFINDDHQFIRAENSLPHNVILEDFQLNYYSPYTEATPTIHLMAGGGGSARCTLLIKGGTGIDAANIDMQPVNLADNEAFIRVEHYGGISGADIMALSQNHLGPGEAMASTRYDMPATTRFNKAIVYKFGTALANSATPSVADGSVFNTTGTTTITNMTGGVAGQIVIIIMATGGTLTITHGTNFWLKGAVNYVMSAGMTLQLVRTSANDFWYEIGRNG